jgi:hypothetical protein
MKTLCLLLAFTSPALGSSVTFGDSWDGNPPGTFAMLTGIDDFAAGAPDFSAGVWQISVDGGFSAWYAQDVIGYESGTLCTPLDKPRPPQTPVLQTYTTVTQVEFDRPWHLCATTPSVTHATSNGPQFALTQVSATLWRWGLEDITLDLGDRDYQDLYGTIRLMSAPTREPRTPLTPVPEPSSLWMIGVGMLFLARHGR